MHRLGSSHGSGFLSGSQWQCRGTDRRRHAGCKRFAAGQSRKLNFHTVFDSVGFVSGRAHWYVLHLLLQNPHVSTLSRLYTMESGSKSSCR